VVKTRFSSTVTTPSESMSAVSPRVCVTFPVMITVLPVKASRYWEVMRGVEICSAMFVYAPLSSSSSSLRGKNFLLWDEGLGREDVDADLETRLDMLRLDLARVVENQG
jgi:streptomycin 6-kinase